MILFFLFILLFFFFFSKTQAVEGLRNSPSNKMKIRLNSFLNAAGKRGSRAGNAFAVIAMLFSLAEGKWLLFM